MPVDCHCIYDSHVCSHFSIWGLCQRTPLQFHVSNMSSYGSTTFILEGTDRMPSPLYKLSCVCTCPVQRVWYFGFQIWRCRSRKCYQIHKLWSTSQSNNSKKRVPTSLNWNQIEIQAKSIWSPFGLHLDSVFGFGVHLDSISGFGVHLDSVFGFGVQMDSKWTPNGLRMDYAWIPNFRILCCVWSFIVQSACRNPIHSGCFRSMCHRSCELLCVRFVVLLAGWRVCRCAW